MINNPSRVTQKLCQRLNELRLERNISQQELADMAGISRSTLARMADESSNLSFDSFVRIALALGLGDQISSLIPPLPPSPIEMLKHPQKDRSRKRARKSNSPTPFIEKHWAWDK